MNIDIKHIAKLARLHIEDEQLEKFENQMQDIVTMVENLPDIDEKIILNEKESMKLRKDLVGETSTEKFSREELMKNAPQVKAGCLVVPKTVE